MSVDLPSQADKEQEVQNNNEQKEQLEKQITQIENIESSGSERIASIEKQLSALKEGLEHKLEEINKTDAVASVKEQKEQAVTPELTKIKETPVAKEPLVNRVVGSIPILGEVNDLFRARKLHSRIKKLQGSTAEITANGSVNNVAIQAEQLADTIAYSEQVLGTSVVIPMLENGLNKDAIRSFQSELLTESEDVLKEIKG